MSTSTLGLFLRHLALSEEVSRLGVASDHDLLAAYEPGRGDAAFTELMRRHGPMVLRTCRRVLGQETDAEDAFQATFVLLARKATQLRSEVAGPLSLGGWLHRVAYRTALKALTGKVRRKVCERQAPVMTQPDPDPFAKATWNEIRPILDAELNALPDEARQLLIACYLQEKTHAEAAVELGLPQGSIAWHLQRARALLAKRLARRGITVSALLLVMLLQDAAKGAGVPAVLQVHTVEAARTFTEQANGMVSEHVARLVKGGLAQMTKGSTHLSTALAGWLGLLGAGLIACQTLKAWPDRTSENEPSAVDRLAQEENKSVRTDRYGDPLPPGALARLGTVRLRQTQGVQSLAFTRDGKGLITAGGKVEPVRLWDITTGRMLRQFGGGSGKPIYCTAALSPDGRTLVGSVGAAGDLGLWDVATGTLLYQLRGSRASDPTHLTFSPDGKTVASADGTTLRLWEAATGKELWAARQERIAAFTYSADSKTLIWSGFDGDLHLWDAATGKEIRLWDDVKKRPISVLARAPDGRLFMVYGHGGTGNSVRLWDMAADQEVWRLEMEKGSIVAAAFSPDGKVLATAGAPCGPLCLRDAATGKELRRCEGSRCVQSLAFSPDGKTLASGCQTVRLWDVNSGREVRRPLLGHEVTVDSVTFTPDGKDIVSSSQDGSLRMWDAATGEQRRQVLPAGDEHFIGGTNAIVSTVSPDGKILLSANWDVLESNCRLRVRRWDRENGRELDGWSWAIEGTYAPVISPGGKSVACVTRKAPPNPVVHHWEMATGKELASVAGAYPAFSADGKLLVTAPLQVKDGESGSFTLWEAATGKELCSVPLLEGCVHRLLFSPDSRMLATMSNGLPNRRNALHLWSLLRDKSSKSPVRVGPPRELAVDLSQSWFGTWVFSPDGRTLAFSAEKGTIRLVETASGKERGRFSGHSGHVEALSFAADGRRLASGSRDTTILVWDVTGRLHEGRLRQARLSDKELEKLWTDLAVDDAGRAGRAIWTLTAAPDQAVPYLREHLRTLAADAQEQMAKVPQLLHDLDNDMFAVRKKAQKELNKLGAVAEPALRQALSKKGLSVEIRRNLKQLLQALEAERQAPSGESLRGVRALEVLEHIGTQEARETLKALTAGTETESSLTQEAQAALERLDRTEGR